VLLQVERYAQMAQRVQAKVTESVRKHAVRLQSSANNGRSGKVLYVVYTGAQLYSTRAKWIMETWGAQVPASDIIFVGDKPPTDVDLQALRGATVHETACNAHDHWEGMCCKWAEGTLLTQQLMKSTGAFEWAYLVDDDVYVRPDAMRTYLAQQKDAGRGGRVFGLFGCHTDKCKDGLCGGGGYAADLAAMTAIVGDSPLKFVKNQMKNCHKCEGWADVALAMIFHKKGLITEHLPGANGWRNSKTCFDEGLVKREPLMYHYIKTEGQMKFLNELFATSGELAPFLHDNQTRCANYTGRTHCSPSSQLDDLPWDPVMSDLNQCTS